MGRQQIILLVLAIVVVGFAIVVGVRAFSENSTKANADDMLQDALRIASDVQVWKTKGVNVGRQRAARKDDFSGITLARLGYPASGDPAAYTNPSGTFTLTGSATEAVVVGTNALHRNAVRVTVTGSSDSDITGVITCLGGSGAECPGGDTSSIAGSGNAGNSGNTENNGNGDGDASGNAGGQGKN